LILTKESPGFQDNQLNIVLAEDEAYKVTTMSDAGNNWLRVRWILPCHRTWSGKKS